MSPPQSTTPLIPLTPPKPYTPTPPHTLQLDSVPVVHGSALFSRGETQSLCTVTVGRRQEQQRSESLLGGESSKRLFVNYAFPPYAVDDTSNGGCGVGVGGPGGWVGKLEGCSEKLWFQFGVAVLHKLALTSPLPCTLAAPLPWPHLQAGSGGRWGTASLPSGRCCR